MQDRDPPSECAQMKMSPSKSLPPVRTFPPRNGGTVTVIAEGQINSGEVSPDGNAIVFGEFKRGKAESVYRWKDGKTIKLNDSHSSYQARCNHDASVVAFHRYSLEDATDKTGNWDIARWEDGQLEVIADSPSDESSPDVSESGDVIVYDRTNPIPGSASIMRWNKGETEEVTDGSSLDLFAETSGDGKRIAFRRNLDELWINDQNGVTKPIVHPGMGPAGVMMDRVGDKILYAARDKSGEQDLFLFDTSTSTTTEISALKDVDEYNGYLSGDAKSIVFTGIDRRKDKADMNVYVWRDGETEQLTWNDGGLNTNASISADGNAVSWLWIDEKNTSNRKLLLWQKDQD